MIRHEIAPGELYQRIEKENPGWMAKAAVKTERNVKAASPTFPSIWSQIKQVYIALQGSKCAFCEKWLEDEKIEHDVEHFRPKGKVKRCEVPASMKSAGITIRQPASGVESGYRRLAYHPLNYVAACMTCNRVLKKSYFPIAGTRQPDASEPAACTAEKPFLIYPLSDIDQDPEELIEFHGLSPEAKVSSGFRRCRGLVTIWFFRLDDWRQRKELNKDRAEFLEKLLWALRQRDRPTSSPNEMQEALQAIKRLTSKRFRHSNCLRSFSRLYESDRTEAEAIYAKVADFLKSISP
jgi:hypothetical protein